MKKVIVALDVNSRGKAINLAKHGLDPALCNVKVGMELFNIVGPDIIQDLRNLNYDVFLDLKYKDIPNTVKSAVKTACSLGVWMLNVHADGGKKMMMAAAEAVAESSHKPILLGVTVLTSMDIDDLYGIGIDYTPQQQVLRLAALADDSGLNGVVCSGKEIAALRLYLGNDFKLVVPGIRLPDGDVGDQKRIVTPEQAFADGADYIVVGRPITAAKDTMDALIDFHRRSSNGL